MQKQVTFLCNEFCAPESVKRPLASLVEDNSRRFSRLIPEHEHRSLYHLRNPVLEYSRRHLTHQSDGLNAFLGVLNHFMYRSDPRQPEAGILHLFWGLTVRRGAEYHDCTQEDKESWFADLLWHHPTPTTRRSGFPSWSWVGWHGPCELNFNSHVKLRSEHCEIAGLGDGHRFQSLQLLADNSLAEVRQGQRSSLKSGPAESKLRTSSRVLPIRVERLELRLSETQRTQPTKVSTRHSDVLMGSDEWPRSEIGLMGAVACFQICEDIYIGLNAHFDQELSLEKQSCVLGLILGYIHPNKTEIRCLLVHHLHDDVFERVGCIIEDNLASRYGDRVFLDATGRILDEVTLPHRLYWVVKQDLAMAEKREVYII